ncbi:hypothetical protein Droror1_Dr00027747 [Drosera rotundifolia]
MGERERTEETVVTPPNHFQCHARRVKKLPVEVGYKCHFECYCKNGTLRRHDFREGVSCPLLGFLIKNVTMFHMQLCPPRAAVMESYSSVKTSTRRQESAPEFQKMLGSAAYYCGIEACNEVMDDVEARLNVCLCIM